MSVSVIYTQNGSQLVCDSVNCNGQPYSLNDPAQITSALSQMGVNNVSCNMGEGAPGSGAPGSGAPGSGSGAPESGQGAPESGQEEPGQDNKAEELLQKHSALLSKNAHELTQDDHTNIVANLENIKKKAEQKRDNDSLSKAERDFHGQLAVSIQKSIDAHNLSYDAIDSETHKNASAAHNEARLSSENLLNDPHLKTDTGKHMMQPVRENITSHKNNAMQHQIASRGTYASSPLPVATAFPVSHAPETPRAPIPSLFKGTTAGPKANSSLISQLRKRRRGPPTHNGGTRKNKKQPKNKTQIKKRNSTNRTSMNQTSMNQTSMNRKSNRRTRKGTR